MPQTARFLHEISRPIEEYRDRQARNGYRIQNNIIIQHFHNAYRTLSNNLCVLDNYYHRLNDSMLRNMDIIQQGYERGVRPDCSGVGSVDHMVEIHQLQYRIGNYWQVSGVCIYDNLRVEFETNEAIGV